jgi:outer membrane protein OmpA-like peptidoglycan-associated protein
MDDKTTFTKGRVAAAMFVWLSFLGVLTLGYIYLWVPHQKWVKEQHAKKEQKQILERTSAPSRYRNVVNFALDSFSGYAPFRSSFKEEAAKFGIRADMNDDQANYPQRFKLLAEGKLDMATFTLDALVKCASQFGETNKDVLNVMPTVVDIIDETKGADAMMASKQRFPNIDALNIPDLQIYCVADSPSETLARVVMAYFNLDRVPQNPFHFCNSIDAVYREYQNTKPTESKVFIVWEPFVSKMLDNPDYHSLVDSSKFRGYIVDVLVARRGFYVQNETLVDEIVKSWRTSLFQHRNDMLSLVIEDAKLTGTPLKQEHADRLVKTIWWKNTQESFGHFGLTSGHNLQHIEEIINNIVDVLTRTKAISQDPTNGEERLWYTPEVMKRLFDSSWHPGFGNEQVRQEDTLPPLSDQQWKELRPVGTLSVPRLVFARGTARLNEASYQTLDSLVENLKSWTHYYLTVQGNTSGEDTEANRLLAQARAAAAMEYLASKGVSRSRIHAETAVASGSTTVAFILGELPY